MKQLSEENWLTEDPTIAFFVGSDPATGGRQWKTLTKEDWLRQLLAPTLASSVPQNLHGLVETARGAMIYGSLFYPLFTLGSEQLFRVVEAGLKAKCSELGFPRVGWVPFGDRADWLLEQGVIDSMQRTWLNAVWDLRNLTTHSESQMIDVPSGAVSVLTRTVAFLNHLFPPKR